MPELGFLRQAPLDRLGLAARAASSLGAAGVGLSELRFRGALTLRARRDDPEARQALAAALGAAELPGVGRSAAAGEALLLGLGPDEWLAIGPADAGRLRAALEGRFVGITDVGENWTTLVVTGPRARDLLAKGCPIDLHPANFAVGACAGTLVAKANVVLLLADLSPRFELLVRRSFADYLFRWLEDGAREYGLAILAG